MAVTAVAVTYIIVGKLSLQLALVQPSASPVWPPAGIAVAALLFLGYRAWPAIFVAAFAVNVTTAGNIATSLSIAGGNALEALSGAWLINRFAGGTRVFERAQDVFKFVLIAMVCSAISASIGPTSLLLGGFAPRLNYSAIWFTWWLGDMSGYLVVAPFVVLWWLRPRWQESVDRTLEAICVLLSVILITETVFGGWFSRAIESYPVYFICGPIIIWTAFRFTQRETITAIFVLSAIALWGTLNGFGPFQFVRPSEALLLLQAWTAVLTLTAMTLAAAMAERRRAEAALEHQKQAVELANRTKDNFLAMLSHELRTPLTPVIALLDLLEMEPDHKPELREDLQLIRRNIELQKRLVDDLLDLTRIARGKLKLDLEPIDAHEAIKHVAQMCRSEIDSNQLHLTLDLRARDFCVAADEAKFRQIIWNLVKNAIKFTPPGGQIGISSTNEESRQLVITVRDTGRGIEPEQLGRIFDAFEQGDLSSQQRQGGLGLGLAISKAFADGHGASLSAISEGRDRGTTFRLTIEAIDARHLPARDGEVAKHVMGRRPLRILLVEDHADSSAALKNLLGRRGHTVHVASDVRSALAVAAANSLDLLISDVGLPDGTGTELMSKLRDTGVRGIAISGFGMRADVERSLAAGFSQHLVKPLNLAALEEAIEDAVVDQPLPAGRKTGASPGSAVAYPG